MAQHELIDLEKEGWRALSSSGEVAAEFYERVLDEMVVMLLPGGLVLDDRVTIVQSMAGQPWSAYDLENLRVLQPTEDTAAVLYDVVAQRTGQPEYSALISSVYVRRGDEWKLTLHQQTPR
jgi:hypothetical protein